MIYIYRTKFYADGTVKHIEAKECNTPTESESKCLRAFADDIVDSKLKGSLTTAVGNDGFLYYVKAWDRKDYPLDLVVESPTEPVAEEVEEVAE